ncbi:hypothetical protein M1116_02310 [Patescibacteria group bacterium]|nr:hypothetical protein [Patescibacteria group bacterium]
MKKLTLGFTLTEMMVYIGLFSIFLLVLTEIFVSILDVQKESEALSSVEQDSRFIVARLIYDIQRAHSIDLPSTLGSQGSTLSLTINSTTNTYALNGDNIAVTIGGTATQFNSFDTTVSNLLFQHLGNPGGKLDSVEVSFTVTSRTVRPSGPEIKNVDTVINLRPNSS